MLYFFPDVTVDRKGHVVVVVLMLGFFLLVVEGHHFDQAERLLLGFLHCHGRVFSKPCCKPSPVHDGGRGTHHRVIGRLEHGENGSVSQREVATRGGGFKLKGHHLNPSWGHFQQFQMLTSALAVIPLLHLRFQPHQATWLRILSVSNSARSQLADNKTGRVNSNDNPSVPILQAAVG